MIHKCRNGPSLHGYPERTQVLGRGVAAGNPAPLALKRRAWLGNSGNCIPLPHTPSSSKPLDLVPISATLAILSLLEAHGRSGCGETKPSGLRSNNRDLRIEYY